jgi:hypothetical protein
LTSCFSALAAPLRPPPGPRIATSVLSMCVRGVDLPCTSAHWPWEGWGAATHARPAAAPRPVLKCASAQGGAGWRTRRRPFQGWKVLVKLVFWALKPRQPAPTPENVGPPPKLGPPPVPVTTTYVLPLCGGHRALGTKYTPVAYWRRHGPGKKQLGECPGLHGTPRQRFICILGSWSTWPEGGGFA